MSECILKPFKKCDQIIRGLTVVVLVMQLGQISFNSSLGVLYLPLGVSFLHLYFLKLSDEASIEGKFSNLAVILTGEIPVSK